MKRIVLIMLVLSILFSFCSCSTTNNMQKQDETSNTEQEKSFFKKGLKCISEYTFCTDGQEFTIPFTWSENECVFYFPDLSGKSEEPFKCTAQYDPAKRELLYSMTMSESDKYAITGIVVWDENGLLVSQNITESYVHRRDTPKTTLNTEENNATSNKSTISYEYFIEYNLPPSGTITYKLDNDDVSKYQVNYKNNIISIFDTAKSNDKGQTFEINQYGDICSSTHQDDGWQYDEYGNKKSVKDINVTLSETDLTNPWQLYIPEFIHNCIVGFTGVEGMVLLSVKNYFMLQR